MDRSASLSRSRTTTRPGQSGKPLPTFPKADVTTTQARYAAPVAGNTVGANGAYKVSRSNTTQGITYASTGRNPANVQKGYTTQAKPVTRQYTTATNGIKAPPAAAVKRSNTAPTSRTMQMAYQEPKLPAIPQVTEANANWVKNASSSRTGNPGPSSSSKANITNKPLPATQQPVTAASKRLPTLPPPALGRSNTTPIQRSGAAKYESKPSSNAKTMLGRSKSDSQRPGAMANDLLKRLMATKPQFPASAPEVPVTSDDLAVVRNSDLVVLDSGLTDVTGHIVHIVESGGQCLEPALRPLFGRHAPAESRIIWQRNADNDQAVKSLLEWVDKTRWGISTLGLHRFMQTKKKGGLFFNVVDRMPASPNEPAVDWLTFEEIQKTLDSQLQQFMRDYDPSKYTLVFIYRVSPTGDRLRIWGKMIGVPENLPQMYKSQISSAMKAVSKSDKHILTDENPNPPKTGLMRKLSTSLRRKL